MNRKAFEFFRLEKLLRFDGHNNIWIHLDNIEWVFCLHLNVLKRLQLVPIRLKHIKIMICRIVLLFRSYRFLCRI